MPETTKDRKCRVLRKPTEEKDGIIQIDQGGKSTTYAVVAEKIDGCTLIAFSKLDGSTSGTTYQIFLRENERHSCTCPDSKRRRKIKTHCKHVACSLALHQRNFFGE